SVGTLQDAAIVIVDRLEELCLRKLRRIIYDFTERTFFFGEPINHRDGGVGVGHLLSPPVRSTNSICLISATSRAAPRSPSSGCRSHTNLTAASASPLASRHARSTNSNCWSFRFIISVSSDG